MKRLLFLLGFLLSFHFYMAQIDDSVWKSFQAKVENGDSVFRGNGYRIETKSIHIPPFKSKIKRFFRTGLCKDEDYYWSLAKSLLGYYDKKDVIVSKEGHISTFSYIQKSDRDSIPMVHTAYIKPVTECLLSGVAFSKRGDIDTVYQKQLADAVWNNHIPQSLFVPDNKDTIYFFGQKIAVYPIPYGGNEPMYAYESGLKEFSSSYSYYKSAGNYVHCLWDSFLTDEEAERMKGNLVINCNKQYKTILFEGKDTVLFRGKEILADRIVGQNHAYRGGYDVTTNYFIKSEFENLPVLIALGFTVEGDSIGADMPLPSFIEENIFRLKNVPPAVAIIKDSIPAADTLFIKKKNRLPIWTYYDKNTRITGLSLGIGEINKLRNVTTNGIKLDVIGSSLALAAMPPFLLIPPSLVMDLNRRWQIAEPAILYKNRFSITNGISFSVAGSLLDSHIINGIGFGGLLTINYCTNGISVAGLNNGLTYNNGLQVAGFWACARKSNGMQIGALGVQGHEVRGVQIGAFNFVTNRISGLQAGIFNTAAKSSGLQIGLLNQSKKLRGFQIGLWNKSDRRSLPFFNWGF